MHKTDAAHHISVLVDCPDNAVLSFLQDFIHYLSPEGTELAKENFHNYKWNPINGITYVNGPDPANPWGAPVPPAA
jgi:hypothetical protein